MLQREPHNSQTLGFLDELESDYKLWYHIGEKVCGSWFSIPGSQVMAKMKKYLTVLCSLEIWE